MRPQRQNVGGKTAGVQGQRTGGFGRRGMMYTVVSLLLLLVVANIFFTQSRRTGEEPVAATAERVRMVNAFIGNFEKDSERAAYIAGFRTFIAMEQHVTSTGEFLADPDSTFKEGFLTGSINGTNYTILQNSSFNEYVARAQYAAGRQGIDLHATVTDVRLWHIDAWTVLVNYTLEMNVTDSRGTAGWRINRTLTGRIPITDLRDPLFTAGTYGRIQRVVKPTNVTLFVDDAGDKNDTTGLMLHFNNSYYVAAGRGPTMLMRFAGNLSDSPYGIESLIDSDDFVAQSLPFDSTKTVVDYLYFQNVTATDCNIQNTPSRIRLDDNSSVKYQVQGRLTTTGCP